MHATLGGRAIIKCFKDTHACGDSHSHQPKTCAVRRCPILYMPEAQLAIYAAEARGSSYSHAGSREPCGQVHGSHREVVNPTQWHVL